MGLAQSAPQRELLGLTSVPVHSTSGPQLLWGWHQVSTKLHNGAGQSQHGLCDPEALGQGELEWEKHQHERWPPGIPRRRLGWGKGSSGLGLGEAQEGTAPCPPSSVQGPPPPQSSPFL